MAQCRNVTRMLTLEKEIPISPYRKVLVAWHLLICPNCRRHRKTLQQIQHALSQDETLAAAENVAMPVEVKNRIAQSLQRQR